MQLTKEMKQQSDSYHVNFVCINWVEVVRVDLHFFTQFVNHFSEACLKGYSIYSRSKVNIFKISSNGNFDVPLHTRTQIVVNILRYVGVTLAASTLTIFRRACITV